MHHSRPAGEIVRVEEMQEDSQQARLSAKEIKEVSLILIEVWNVWKNQVEWMLMHESKRRFPSTPADFRSGIVENWNSVQCLKSSTILLVRWDCPTKDRSRLLKVSIIDSSKNSFWSLVANSTTSPLMTQSEIFHRTAVQKWSLKVKTLGLFAESTTVLTM